MRLGLHLPPGSLLGRGFEVALAGTACDFSNKTLKAEFGNNFHVRYRSVLERQKNVLVLVKGGPRSRLFQKAYRISEEGKDRSGKPLKVLSRKMQRVFGDFGGHVSIQRSPPRWVDPAFVDKAIGYLMNLEKRRPVKLFPLPPPLLENASRHQPGQGRNCTSRRRSRASGGGQTRSGGWMPGGCLGKDCGGCGGCGAVMMGTLAAFARAIR